MALPPFLPIADIGAGLFTRNGRVSVPQQKVPDARLRQASAVGQRTMTNAVYGASAPNKIRRMEIHNLTNGDILTAQFNPTELEEAIKPNWNRQTIPGMSHPNLQYSHTDPHTFQIALFFDALEVLQMPGVLRGSGPGVVPSSPTEMGGTPMLARQFLQALCYAKHNASSIVNSAPSRALFFWPNFITMTCVIDDMSFRHTKFAPNGKPLQFTCDLTLIEIRDVRLVSDDVREVGTLRLGPLEETL